MKKRVGGELKHTVSDQTVLLDEVPRFKCGALEILRCAPTAERVVEEMGYLLRRSSLHLRRTC